jgi:hypothetical protein
MAGDVLQGLQYSELRFNETLISGLVLLIEGRLSGALEQFKELQSGPAVNNIQAAPEARA